MKVKANLTLDEKIKELGINYAEKMGMSLSAFISMCIVQYDMQVKALEIGNNFERMVERMDSFEKEIKNHHCP